MCSIFAAFSKNDKKIDYDLCISCLKETATRGPDSTFHTYKHNLFIGVNVLSLTGTPSIKNFTCEKGTLAYNGEIYNYNKQLYDTDTEELFIKLISSTNRYNTTRDIEGMFCYVFYDKTTHDLYFARDVFGEKTLYIYEDNEILIASSTIHGIEQYIGKLHITSDLLHSYFHTRHFLTYNNTIYKNVRQLLPGTIEVYNTLLHTKHIQQYENITDYIDTKQIERYNNVKAEEIIEELDSILHYVIQQMISHHHQSVSFSGGIDSSLIAYYIAQYTDNYSLIGTNCIGKDYISNNLKKFQPFFKNPITTININEQEWCNTIKETYNITLSPLGSHNYCTKIFISKYLQKNNIKLIFGGEGADELFGGYDFYYKINDTQSCNISPYSSMLTTNVPFVLDTQCYVQEQLSNVWDTAYKVYRNAVLATSLSDTQLVVNDDGVRNNDQVAGWFGIEGRSPFLHKKMLKFALNLPAKYKRGKPLLKQLFEKKFPGIHIEKKQGFAGFPNETQFYFYKHNETAMFNNIDITKYDKPTQWKLLNIYYFYESYNSRNFSRTSRA